MRDPFKIDSFLKIPQYRKTQRKDTSGLKMFFFQNRKLSKSQRGTHFGKLKNFRKNSQSRKESEKMTLYF